MRKNFIASIFVLSFCAFAFGQDKKAVSCPTVYVTGPSSSVQQGEDLVFKATVDFPNPDKFIYEWSATENGVIIDGQGKNVATLRAVNREVVTVTVEIKGLPEGCPITSDSESTVTDCGIPPRMIDRVGDLSDVITNKRLDIWIADLKADPSSRLYIISYKKKNFPPKKYKDREVFIEKYLISKNVQTDRVVFIKEDVEKQDYYAISVFIVPEGAEPPTP